MVVGDGEDDPTRTRVEDLDALTDPLSLGDALTERLDAALALDAELNRLTEQIAELEVAEIADLVGGTNAADELPGTPAERASVGAAIQRKRTLEERLDALLGRNRAPQSDEERLRLEEACASLQAWLDAPDVVTSKVPEKAARVVLLIATLLACWGAYAVHPAVLVLLIPVAAPLSMLLNRGDDTRWRRLGAERRFARTEFDSPPWDKESVAARLAQLRAELAELPVQGAAPVVEVDEPTADREFGELSMELVEVEQLLKGKLRRLGLDPEQLNAGQRATFLDAAATARRGDALRDARRERARMQREVGDLRDSVWRTLRKRGVSDVDPLASDAALREALLRLPGLPRLRIVHSAPEPR